ncbi:MAG: hypothetical protein ABII27_08275 [bacterium]
MINSVLVVAVIGIIILAGAGMVVSFSIYKQLIFRLIFISFLVLLYSVFEGHYVSSYYLLSAAGMLTLLFICSQYMLPQDRIVRVLNEQILISSLLSGLLMLVIIYVNLALNNFAIDLKWVKQKNIFLIAKDLLNQQGLSICIVGAIAFAVLIGSGYIVLRLEEKNE